MFNVLEELVKTIRERKNSSEHESYTKKLLMDNNLCREKVMEEINEISNRDDSYYEPTIFIDERGLETIKTK